MRFSPFPDRCRAVIFFSAERAAPGGRRAGGSNRRIWCCSDGPCTNMTCRYALKHLSTTSTSWRRANISIPSARRFIFTADGAYAYHRQFRGKSLRYRQCGALHNAVLYISRGHKAQADEKTVQRILAGCEKRVDSYVAALMEGKAGIQGRHLGWLGDLQRLPYRFSQRGAGTK